MPEITIKDGVVSAVVYVQCTRDYECECGAKSTITMSLPEGVTYKGAITVKGECPACGEAITIPDGYHYVEDYKLLTKEPLV